MNTKIENSSCINDMCHNSVGSAVPHTLCTGCSICMIICPKNAILMKPDKQSFILPHVNRTLCVNCGKCVDICPALHNVNDNVTSPDIYAFRANDSIRYHSSSGGAFSVLSMEILAMKGNVCGAIFDNKHRLYHVVTNSTSEISVMRGSKYIQSDVNSVYNEISTILKKRVPLLFSGLPCQVAALKAFLGDIPDNLFTVDLVCHGVPSQGLFQKYLGEIAGGRRVTHVSFRDKQHGWQPGKYTLRIQFADGETYEGTSEKDHFIKAFNIGLSLRSSCIDCQFCTFPRQGDMTLGDFWWYHVQQEGDCDEGGTSLILVNNQKGYNLLDMLRKSSILLKKVDTNPAKLPNRLSPKLKVGSARERFLDLCQNHTFSKAFSLSTSGTYDVGIVGPHENGNIGGFLTYFALYNTISDMGYTVLMIGTPRSAEWGKYDNRDDYADKPVYPAYAIAKPEQSNEGMRIFNKLCEQFVTGSDQIFQPRLYANWGKYIRQDFVADYKKKIAYAASFGSGISNFSNPERAELAYYLRKFDNFSVREKDAVSLCKTEFGIHAEHVADPVFLCDIKHYNRLANEAVIQNDTSQKFCHAYIIAASNGKQKIIEEVSSLKRMPYRIYGDYFYTPGFYLENIKGTINARLRDWRDCSFTITDSFHGFCFALIFKKDFILWPMFNWSYSRFESLLNITGLHSRVIYSLEDFENRKEELLSPVDYVKVYARLTPFIEASRAWLSTSLKYNCKKPMSDFDIISTLLSKKQNNIEKTIQDVNKNIATLKSDNARRIVPNLVNINNFHEYIKAINAKKYTILIAANDTPANPSDESISSSLMMLGLKTPLHKFFRRAWLAIISQGDLIHECIGEAGQILTRDQTLDDVNISMMSAPYGCGCKAEIIINDRDWSINKRGLNFVVLRLDIMEIIDSVCFDTFDMNIPAQR